MKGNQEKLLLTVDTFIDVMTFYYTRVVILL